MTKLIEFETERLILRQWRESDFEPFAALNADPKVMEYFPELLDREASDELADRIRSLINERGWGFWAVEVKGGEHFVGYCGLHIPSTNLPFSPCVEIGWRLAVAHWGKGYATEAAKGALRVGFEELELPEIVSFTTVGNHRSQQVMKRIGMTYSQEFQHPKLPERSPLRSHLLYRLSQENYRAQQQ